MLHATAPGGGSVAALAGALAAAMGEMVLNYSIGKKDLAAHEPVLREACTRANVRTLRSDGARWLRDGTTSLAELLRVTGAAS